MKTIKSVKEFIESVRDYRLNKNSKLFKDLNSQLDKDMILDLYKKNLLIFKEFANYPNGSSADDLHTEAYYNFLAFDEYSQCR